MQKSYEIRRNNWKQGLRLKIKILFELRFLTLDAAKMLHDGPVKMTLQDTIISSCNATIAIDFYRCIASKNQVRTNSFTFCMCDRKSTYMHLHDLLAI